VPRFYFHLHNDIDSLDEEGREVADTETARRMALVDARHMAAESVREGHLNRAHFVEVCSEDGKPLFRVTFGAAVEIIG
jgi:hypothetical protein